MNKLICLCGGSGCGKDTLAQMITDKYDIDVLVSHTTRPMRKGEINGKTYHFVDDNTFNELEDGNNIVASRKYNTEFGVWKYGLSVEEINSKLSKSHCVTIVDMGGLEQLKAKYGDQIVSIYLYLDKDTRAERYVNRDKVTFDGLKECIRRIEDDEIVFKDARFKTDLSFYNRNTRQTFDQLKLVLRRYDIELG